MATPPLLDPSQNLSKEKVVCNCKKSYCLKLYCDCFRKGLLCSDYCTCQSCYNNAVYEEKRKDAIQSILSKNQNAFRTNVSRGLRPVEEVGKGCHCVKSHCLKKYCECFQIKRYCDGKCRCLECQNESGFSHEQNVPKTLIGFGYKNILEYEIQFARPLVVSEIQLPSTPLDKLISGSVVDQICNTLLNAASKELDEDQDERLPILKAFASSLEMMLSMHTDKREHDNSSSEDNTSRFKRHRSDHSFGGNTTMVL